ncbi:MAG: stage III sporulation protein AB [Clostridia bacterium]|nr:stage III sporulation protein AB [Clostridia bacterium]
MWLKFAVALLIVAVSVFVGYLSAGKYRLRKSYFQAFQSFNEKFLAELCYTRRALAEFIQKERKEGDFYHMANCALVERDSVRKPSYLSEDEYEYLMEYFHAVGRADAKTQTGWFATRKGELERSCKEAEAEAKNRGELYLKLGLLSGLAIVILIV